MAFMLVNLCKALGQKHQTGRQLEMDDFLPEHMKPRKATASDFFSFLKRKATGKN